jgi:ParB family chromosome partitioning protein
VRSNNAARKDTWDAATSGGRLTIVGSETRSPHTADVSRETPVQRVTEPQGLSETASEAHWDREPVDGIDEGSGLAEIPGTTFGELPVDAIRPNQWQPRSVFDEHDLDELVESIKTIGVLQPIVVRPDKVAPGNYELIMGERRWRASKRAGKETVPAIVRTTDDSEMLREALLENLHRADLNPLEEAAAYRQLLDDFGCTHDELATRLARSRPQISNTLRLLKLPALVQRRVAAGILSAGHARALLGLTDGADMEKLAQRIVSEGLSVRAIEEIVALSGASEHAQTKERLPQAENPAATQAAQRLGNYLDTRVKVALGKNKGRVTIEFAGTEDLERIVSMIEHATAAA